MIIANRKCGPKNILADSADFIWVFCQITYLPVSRMKKVDTVKKKKVSNMESIFRQGTYMMYKLAVPCYYSKDHAKFTLYAGQKYCRMIEGV